MKRILLSLALLFAVSTRGADRPNILLLTVDDMSCDSVGVFGSKLADTTPNMDKLASQSLRFAHAHVTVGNCMPCRNVMFSGLYSHNNKVEGFYQVKNPGWPHLVDLMKGAGYFTGIRGKVSHSAPYQPYAWDANLDTLPDGSKGHMKDPKSYGISTADGIAKAKAAGKPFCLVVNISDPHKPFWSKARGGGKDPYIPSRIFKASEVPIPGFLFDDPQVREELALYYSSVRRADDCVGEVLAALRASGEMDNTVVMFMSDHGMPLPFAKTQLYHHSTHTPWMVRWPGVTEAGSVDKQHMISAVDFLPTALDIVGAHHPKHLDGRSYLPLLKGGSQEGRGFVVKEYNENAGRSRDPMRGIQTKKYLYLFNPWSNGERVFATATTGTVTYRRMVDLASSSKSLSARLDLYKHRVPEELYDVTKDPDCLVNLINQPNHQAKLKELQAKLDAWMVRSKDPMLEVFRKREDAGLVEAYVQKLEKESLARRGNKQKNKPKRRTGLLKWTLPKSVTPGQAVKLTLAHKIPKRLGEQLLHVTFRDGSGKRIERKVLKAAGTGEIQVQFDVPKDLQGNQASFAAFIGTEFSKNLQHLTSKPISTK
ncbi:MAG: sulfatase [Verrucomicrobiota bacterium]|nr:sulfatase [Verrucomicrobiota bacterium]